MERFMQDIQDVGKAWAITGLTVGREMLTNGAQSLKEAAGYLENVRVQLNKPIVQPDTTEEEQY